MNTPNTPPPSVIQTVRSAGKFGWLIRIVCWWLFITVALISLIDVKMSLSVPYGGHPISAEQQAGYAAEKLYYLAGWFCIMFAIDALTRPSKAA